MLTILLLPMLICHAELHAKKEARRGIRRLCRNGQLDEACIAVDAGVAEFGPTFHVLGLPRERLARGFYRRPPNGGREGPSGCPGCIADEVVQVCVRERECVRERAWVGESEGGVRERGELSDSLEVCSSPLSPLSRQARPLAFGRGGQPACMHAGSMHVREPVSRVRQ
jgi:hypothetical protein